MLSPHYLFSTGWFLVRHCARAEGALRRAAIRGMFFKEPDLVEGKVRLPG
jgi:hypothetical protein